MSVIGKWKLTMQTPFGVQTPLLEVTENGGSLTGTTGSTPLEDLKIDGSNISFSAKVPTPMGSFPVSFDATAQGNEIKGTYKTMMGSTEFTGTRQ